MFGRNSKTFIKIARFFRIRKYYNEKAQKQKIRRKTRDRRNQETEGNKRQKETRDRRKQETEGAKRRKETRDRRKNQTRDRKKHFQSWATDRFLGVSISDSPGRFGVSGRGNHAPRATD